MRPYQSSSGLLYQFILKNELLMRIELTTSSLPRKCSTPELQQLERSQIYNFKKLYFSAVHLQRISSHQLSGRRASNSRPIAWKAIALPIELLPLVKYYFKKLIYMQWAVVDSNHRSRRQRIYSPLHLATLVTARK